MTTLELDAIDVISFPYREVSLAANEVRTWDRVTTFGYKEIFGIAIATNASATNGLKIKQGFRTDDLTVVMPHITQYTLAANTPIGFVIDVLGEFVEVEYTNGGAGSILQIFIALRK